MNDLPQLFGICMNTYVTFKIDPFMPSHRRRNNNHKTGGFGRHFGGFSHEQKTKRKLQKVHLQGLAILGT